MILSEENYNDIRNKMRLRNYDKYSRVVMIEPEKRTENEQRMHDLMEYIEKNLKKGENDPTFPTCRIYFKELLTLAEKEFDVDFNE